ncbi:MAG: hypothetical protein HC844_02595 [Tabrizicola sp.]|nr:hypothetical protein [Tabrizicola sp.]
MTARVAKLPAAVAELAEPGLRKVVDFQDCGYGALYLDRLDALLAQDHAPFDFTREAAKYVAVAMAYDDVIRVADLKTRAQRFDRIRTEMGLAEGQVLHVTEFMHPRAEEIVGLMPARLGRRVAASPRLMALIDRVFNRGRHLRSDHLWAYVQLYVLGGMKRRRLGSLRHAEEMAHLDHWIGVALQYLPQNYDLATEVIRCRRLVKGYSDTHSRGLSKFDRVLEGIALICLREDAADWARRLREAALKDEEGKELDGALQTIGSFA